VRDAFAPARLARHLLAALAVSYALSVFFWLGLGVFQLVPFFVVSFGVAVVGAAVGILFKRTLWATIGATVVLRVAIFNLATGS
jgi:hypothetical protein